MRPMASAGCMLRLFEARLNPRDRILKNHVQLKLKPISGRSITSVPLSINLSCRFPKVVIVPTLPASH